MTDEADALQLAAALEAIIDAAAGVLAEHSLDATLRGMVGSLRRIVPFTSLAVYELAPAGDVLVPVFASGRYVAETMANHPPVTASLTGRVIRTGEPVHLDPGDPGMTRYTIPGTPDDEESALVFAPLVVGDDVIGTLNVWREGHLPSFSDHDARLIRRFATLAALAYANARQREQLQRLALTDALTGIGNRRAFEERLAAEVARSRREGLPVALALFDLDDFKAINDRHGHPAGDAALRAFAGALGSEARTADTVCRIGGEEFAVVLPGTSVDGARFYAERALAATRALTSPGGRITASAGVASVPEDAASVGNLLRTADARLLAAKAAGKDRVEP